MEILHIFISLGLLGFIQSFLMHHEICEEIMYVDCNIEALPGNKLYRDNNGIIYDNFCTYSQAKCKDSSIDLETVCTCEHPGMNNQVSGTSVKWTPTQKTTMKPLITASFSTPPTVQSTPQSTMGMSTAVPSSVPVSTQKNLVSAFCQNKDLVDCPSNTALICGSDNKSYSRCQLAKAQCDNPNLSITKEGAC
ncbi:Hypothetical predicted protein [Mytilus galloprovincialis]|uniref:Kazal-like domain-containing protein n=2 Tax=Mytilus galloprovincialis TaxID=29158 RepID=A0A8B6H9C6_MYTGA|nr:Hypothetical predicted protein [Mytilus galloprovincialis]